MGALVDGSVWVWLVPPLPSGFPKFTNEVQHFIEVLPWDSNKNRSPLKNGVKLPDYVQPDPRSGKSLQIWIARHRQLLES